VAAEDDKLFNWETTAENAAEIALIRAPLVILNTRATSRATKARIAPYSVIPCPDSSAINLLTTLLVIHSSYAFLLNSG
jgi:hypothetical protein